MTDKKEQYTTVLERYEDDPRLNKLGLAYFFTNSEKIQLGCKRLWAYSNMIGGDKQKTAKALLYGIAWHLVCEHALNEIKQTDTMITVERGIELINTVAKRFLLDEQMNIDAFDVFEFIDDCIARLERAIVGWIPHWANNMHNEFEIISVEQTLCAPVYSWGNFEIDNFTGRQFVGKVQVYKDSKGYMWPLNIYAFSTDFHDIKNENKTLDIPFYRVGKADVIVRRRNTKSLYIVDHKTSASPNGYARKFEYEQQLASYCALLQYEIKRGELQHLKDHKIVGIVWDMAHSKVPTPPKPLKNGTLSIAKSRLSPSWIFEQAIEINGLDRSAYIDHIEHCKQHADPSYFKILHKSISTTDIERSFYEDYATAYKINDLRSDLLSMKLNDNTFQIIAPRYPICQEYQNCSFSHYCQPNTPLSNIDQKKVTKIYWKPLTDNTSCDNLSRDNNFKLPF